MIVFRPNVQSYMPGADIVNRPVVAAAASGWWLADGTIDAANAIAVYQPKGAASLAASYINLANPGTYDAAPGTAPTFDTATGWAFNGSTQYLLTGITPDSTTTVMVRFANATMTGIQVLVGSSRNATSDALAVLSTNVNVSSGHAVFSWGSSASGIGGFNSSGTYALSANDGYVNGAYSLTVPASFTGSGVPLYIGANNYPTDTAERFYAGDILAIAIYNIALSSDEVAAVSTAMAAL